jgi:hypothetical protein
VNGKVTLVHRRVWPSVVRLSAAIIPPERLASIEEYHTAAGGHRKAETPFPAWVPAEAIEATDQLTEKQALDELRDCLRPPS